MSATRANRLHGAISRRAVAERNRRTRLHRPQRFALQGRRIVPCRSVPADNGRLVEVATLFRRGAQKGVLDVDATRPSTLLAHDAGWIDRDNEVIVGLQTDRPFRRAIFPAGGLRMVESGLKAAGFAADPAVHEAFTKYRKTHNDGVFDAYTPEIMRCRRSHVITGLPDAYGRGRIIGDYRRVALYGVDRLLEAKKGERAQIDEMWANEDVIRLREEMAEQMRALRDLIEMGRRYDCDLVAACGKRP